MANPKPDSEKAGGYVMVRLTNFGKRCLEEICLRNGKPQSTMVRELLEPILRAIATDKEGRLPHREGALSGDADVEPIEL